MSESEDAIVRAVLACPIPIVTAVHGVCAGVALVLASTIAAGTALERLEHFPVLFLGLEQERVRMLEVMEERLGAEETEAGEAVERRLPRRRVPEDVLDALERAPVAAVERVAEAEEGGDAEQENRRGEERGRDHESATHERTLSDAVITPHLCAASHSLTNVSGLGEACARTRARDTGDRNRTLNRARTCPAGALRRSRPA